MKKYFLLFVVLFTIITPHFAFSEEIPNRPNFVWAQMLWFEKYYHSRPAYARELGWGTGEIRNGKKFSWYAYTNSDGYIQLLIDCPLPPNTAKSIREKKDFYGKNWSTKNEGKIAWIGTGNDWLDSFCSDKMYGCRTKPAIDEVIAKLNSPNFRIKITDYLFPPEAY